MKEPISTQVSIFGETYMLKGTAPPEHLRRVAEYVDAKMKEIARRNDRLDHKKTAVLAALNIADELMRLERERTEVAEGLAAARALVREREQDLHRLEAELDEARREREALVRQEAELRKERDELRTALEALEREREELRRERADLLRENEALRHERTELLREREELRRERDELFLLLDETSAPREAAPARIIHRENTGSGG
ncbi:cell division protein ZapA [Hydrogenibacillus sp. N12]|uniref:cell division protein ZapA n=1 Tax=Hydrogenibacillus sp. N12 TaxID=2866627 RepID=UPI001C7CF9A8|nr:cell division protein ZapA [Hydrogenibacillus sp. N12]QZA32431.1 cell division protein ZapA [Hydrogenibacillus sp. N12]